MHIKKFFSRVLLRDKSLFQKCGVDFIVYIMYVFYSKCCLVISYLCCLAENILAIGSSSAHTDV